MKHPSFNVEIRGTRTNVIWCNMHDNGSAMGMLSLIALYTHCREALIRGCGHRGVLAGHVSKKKLSGESAQVQSPGYTPQGHTGEEKKQITFLIQMQDRREVKTSKTYKLNELLSTKLLDGRLVTYTM